MTFVLPVQDGAPTGDPAPYAVLWGQYPTTSFPEFPTSAALAPFGYGVFVPTTEPPAPHFQHVVPATPAYDAASDTWQGAWAYTPYTPQEEQAATDAATSQLRRERDAKLYACDWTQLPDVVLTPAEVATWRTYRQALRDYMATVTDPFNPPAWPVPPQS
jgi:hypothetical protein